MPVPPIDHDPIGGILMAHSVVAAYIHFVWTTKYRTRSLTDERRRRVRTHIQEYALQNGIAIKALDVQPEHVHVLVFLKGSQRVDEMAKLLKGESSHWINATEVRPGKFFWQRGYWAGSVSYKHVDTVKRYIENQDAHHKRLSFFQEFEGMLIEHGFDKDQIAELLRL